jgi:RNA polymerase sigma factor (sigma-70 family)
MLRRTVSSGLTLGVEARVYNATIRNRRLDLGLTQRQLAERAGVGVSLVNHMETLRQVRKTVPAMKVLAVLGLDEDAQPDWAEPLELHGVRRKEQSVTAELVGLEPQRLLEAAGDVAVESSFEIASEALSRENVTLALAALSYRERRVLELLYGLGNCDSPRTLAQVGDILNVTRERIRQIENLALKKLQATPDAQSLRDYDDGPMIEAERRREAEEMRARDEAVREVQRRREKLNPSSCPRAPARQVPASSPYVGEGRGAVTGSRSKTVAPEAPPGVELEIA